MTLNYGEIPLYEDFKKAFDAELGENGLYEITIPDGNPDLQVMNYALDVMEADGIDTPEEVCVDENGSPRAGWYFACGQLYKLVETLIDTNHDAIEVAYNITLHEYHWPVNFASSILYTLGIYWI